MTENFRIEIEGLPWPLSSLVRRMTLTDGFTIRIYQRDRGLMKKAEPIEIGGHVSRQGTLTVTADFRGGSRLKRRTQQ